MNPVRILCVLLPHFPLMCELQKNTLLKRHAVAVTYSRGSQKLILDYSPELEHLQRDMPLQQALSLYGQVELVEANIPRYWSVFNKLLNLLEKKSPAVEASDLGCAYLGLDGLQSIYPTDSILISSVREVIPRGFALQMGIAEGKFMAYIAALRSPPGCYQAVTPSRERCFPQRPALRCPAHIAEEQKQAARLRPPYPGADSSSASGSPSSPVRPRGQAYPGACRRA